MTKYILHGGFTSEINELNNSFYRELTRDVDDGAKILFVYFSRTLDEYSGLFENDRQRTLENTDRDNLNFILASQETFLDQLKDSDVVYMRGGNTNQLMHTLKKFPNLSDSFEGKTIAGSSAGAYALATWGTAHNEDSARQGLGILPVKVICHHQSEKLPPTESSVKEIQELDKDLELVLLKDFEWKVFN